MSGQLACGAHEPTRLSARATSAAPRSSNPPRAASERFSSDLGSARNESVTASRATTPVASGQYGDGIESPAIYSWFVMGFLGALDLRSRYQRSDPPSRESSRFPLSARDIT